MRTIVCRRCEQHLPVEAFRPERVGPGTKRDQCKKCGAASAYAWNLAHPERWAKSRERHRPKSLARMKKWNQENRKHLTEYMAEWRRQNPERMRAYGAKQKLASREWANKNKERRAATQRAWRKQNFDRVRAYSTGKKRRRTDEFYAARRARRARLRTHCPKWADMKAIRAIYADARRLSRATGIIHHVDHIIPLRGKTVSGLHVEINLRIVPAIENLRKGSNLMEAQNYE